MGAFWRGAGKRTWAVGCGGLRAVRFDQATARAAGRSRRGTGAIGRCGWNAPTVDDLNDETDREFDWTGVEETADEDRARLEPDTERGWQIARSDEERLRELGIYRMMAMDVRGDRETEDRREWRRR